MLGSCVTRSTEALFGDLTSPPILFYFCLPTLSFPILSAPHDEVRIAFDPAKVCSILCGNTLVFSYTLLLLIFSVLMNTFFCVCEGGLPCRLFAADAYSFSFLTHFSTVTDCRDGLEPPK